MKKAEISIEYKVKSACYASNCPPAVKATYVIRAPWNWLLRMKISIKLWKLAKQYDNYWSCIYTKDPAVNVCP